MALPWPRLETVPWVASIEQQLLSTQRLKASWSHVISAATNKVSDRAITDWPALLAAIFPPALCVCAASQGFALVTCPVTAIYS